jgi:hypothetical protein
LQRLRRQVFFDRLLARLFAEKNAPWLLKGGYAMELRLRAARTTKDIDISLPAQVVDVFDGDVVKLVQQSARIELADFFTFVIRESQLDLNAAPQGGARLFGRCLNRGPSLHQVPSGRRDRRRRRAADGVDRGKELARLCRPEYLYEPFREGASAFSESVKNKHILYALFHNLTTQATEAV